jgi:di/tricarboxylate transporter
MWAIALSSSQLTGCVAIRDMLKAGLWAGVIVVGIVVLLGMGLGHLVR